MTQYSPQVPPTDLPVNFVARGRDGNLYIVTGEHKWGLYCCGETQPLIIDVVDGIHIIERSLSGKCLPSDLLLPVPEVECTVHDSHADWFQMDPADVPPKRKRGRPPKPAQPNKRKGRPPTEYNNFVARRMRELADNELMSVHAKMEFIAQEWHAARSKEI